MDLRKGALDVVIENNVLWGKSGIACTDMMEAAISDNVIFANDRGIVLGGSEFAINEGITMNRNLIMADVEGITCSGALSMNITIDDNRMTGGESGVRFMISPTSKYFLHFIFNAQIGRNCIDTSKYGVVVTPNIAGTLPGIIGIRDIAINDNYISNCGYVGVLLSGTDENEYFDEDTGSFQRMLRGNLLNVKSTAMYIGVNDAKVIDNDITLESGDDLTFGIEIRKGNCTVENNSITVKRDSAGAVLSRGGIRIILPTGYSNEDRLKNLIVSSNRILRGIGSGIEIDCNLEDAHLDGNIIEQMNLNGITCFDGLTAKNLVISNNKVVHCCQFYSDMRTWWKYGGIVLYEGHNVQILGNDIRENGRARDDSMVSGIYAQRLVRSTIADNHLIKNSPDRKGDERNAVICVPGLFREYANTDITVTSNTVKESYLPAVMIGFPLEEAPDFGIIVNGNHFETLAEDEYTVEMYANCSSFNNNHVMGKGRGRYIVTLGYGVSDIAIGNVLQGNKGCIETLGVNVILDPNMYF
jgi:hypothetical protein